MIKFYVVITAILAIVDIMIAIIVPNPVTIVMAAICAWCFGFCLSLRLRER